MKINVVMTCPICGEDHFVEVEDTDLKKYEAGGLAQNCFPYLSATEREQIISGLCPKCQSDVFGW